MDLHEFGHKMRDKVREFERYWRDAIKEDPSCPSNMTEEEWTESLTIYLEA